MSTATDTTTDAAPPAGLITSVSRNGEPAQVVPSAPAAPAAPNSPTSASAAADAEAKKKSGGVLGLLGCCFNSNTPASTTTATTSGNTSTTTDGKDAPATPPAPASLITQVSKTDNASAPAPPPAPASPVSAEENTHLLPPLDPADKGKKCLVLDLDETLVHSSFKPVPNADFIIPVEIDRVVHRVYVQKRPHVDEFLEKLGPMFETVVFTASLSKYADPVMDLLDKKKVVKHRLFREHCTNHLGNYVKDLSRLGRPMGDIIILDNSPTSYMFHPENAVPIGSWFDDPNDVELQDLVPFFEALTKVDDVTAVLDSSSP